MRILDLWKRAGFDGAGLDYLAFCLLRSTVFSADMGGKFFVALSLVVTLHFRERVAKGRPLGIEHPCAFGATAALKTRLFNPYQRAERDHLGRLARRA